MRGPTGEVDGLPGEWTDGMGNIGRYPEDFELERNKNGQGKKLRENNRQTHSLAVFFVGPGVADLEPVV